VRGPGQASVSCQLGAKVVAVSSGQSVAEAAAAPRAFSDRAASARAECLTRAAAVVAPRLSPSPVAAAAGGDLRTLVLDTDVVEPAAIAAFLKLVRGLGSVSSADVRRIVLGRAEIRVRTRWPRPWPATRAGRWR
jgi:hypothetical protein